jgi:hypothetical protein
VAFVVVNSPFDRAMHARGEKIGLPADGTSRQSEGTPSNAEGAAEERISTS